MTQADSPSGGGRGNRVELLDAAMIARPAGKRKCEAAVRLEPHSGT